MVRRCRKSLEMEFIMRRRFMLLLQLPMPPMFSVVDFEPIQVEKLELRVIRFIHLWIVGLSTAA